jgi:hypothetical protein
VPFPPGYFPFPLPPGAAQAAHAAAHAAAAQVVAAHHAAAQAEASQAAGGAGGALAAAPADAAAAAAAAPASPSQAGPPVPPPTPAAGYASYPYPVPFPFYFGPAGSPSGPAAAAAAAAQAAAAAAAAAAALGTDAGGSPSYASLARVMSAQSVTSGGRPRSRSPSLHRQASASRLGSPEFKPTLAGEANKPGGVYDRLASPGSFTGVYRRAYLTDGRINHFTETGVSNVPTRFKGDTNTGSNETIHDIKVLLRTNLNIGKFFR